MKLETQVYRDWSGGVVNSLRADELPLSACPRGINSTLVSVAQGKAIVGKRRGASLVLDTPVYEVDGTTLAEYTSLFQLNYYDSTDRGLDRFFLGTTKSGKLVQFDTVNRTHSVLSSTLFTANTPRPAWSQLNNVAYVTNGTDQKKLTVIAGVPTIQKHGIEAPTKATSSAVSDGAFFAEAIAGGAMTASTWRVSVTYYNSNTGHESNISDYFTLSVLLNQQIRVYWDLTPVDTQATHINVYFLKEGTTTEFRRQTSYRYAVGSGSPQSYGTAADLSTTLMLTFAPEAGTNNVPPTTIKGWVVHNSRLFGWDEQNIYWSDITATGPEPESFRTEAYLPVAPNDGTRITVCHEIDNNVLLIAKEDSLYGLYGVDENSWELRLIDASIGCVAPKSMCNAAGKTYWWSQLGPVQWDGSSAPNQIGYRLLAETTRPSAIFYSNAAKIVATNQAPEQKVVFAYPSSDSGDHNNYMLAFNYELDVWETSRWDAFDVCAFTNVIDSNGREDVYVGGCYGKLFKWWAADVDGIRLSLPQRSASAVTRSLQELTITVGAGHEYQVGQWITLYGFNTIASMPHPLAGVPLKIASINATQIIVTFVGSHASYAGASWEVFCSFTLSGVVISSTTDTLTVAEGTNLDKAANLIGQYLYTYLPGTGSYQRRRITNVSLNTLTFDVATPWDAQPTVAHYWVLSGPFFEWDTRWDDFGAPFDEKRFMFCYVDAICDTGSTSLEIDVYTGGTLVKVQRNFAMSIEGDGAVFDTGTFDVSVFGAESISRLRRRIAAVEYSYRYRIRHFDNNRQLVLLRLGNQAHILTDRRT